MKKKFLLLMIGGLMVSYSSEAQFLKKLKKKAKDAAERTILEKTDEKVSKKTGQAIDTITEGDKKNKSKKIGETEKNTPSKEMSEEEQKAREVRISNIFGGSLKGIPDSYEFTYLMKMTMTTDKESMDIQYYLKPQAEYFGNRLVDDKANTIMVYDMKNNAMVTFMDNGDNKMAMRMPLNGKLQSKMIKKMQEKESNFNGQITPIEGKTILGYKCEGFQVTTDDGVGKIWITNDAPVSLVGVFASAKNLPKSFEGTVLPFTDNSLMMEMIFESNKKKKENMHLICTELQEMNFVINKNDYKTGM